MELSRPIRSTNTHVHSLNTGKLLLLYEDSPVTLKLVVPSTKTFGILEALVVSGHHSRNC